MIAYLMSDKQKKAYLYKLEGYNIWVDIKAFFST